MKLKLKRLLTSFFILLTATSFSNGQTESWYVKLALESIKTDDNGVPRILFAEQIDGTYLVLREQVYRGFKKRRLFIEKLKLDLQMISQKEITEDIDEQHYDIEDVLRFNNRVLVISSQYSSASKNWSFYIQDVNFKAVKLSPRIEIFETNNETGSIRFDVQTSPDQRFIALSFIPNKRVSLLGKQENDYRFVVVLNEDLKISQKAERLDMNKGDLDFLVKQTLINNSGDLYFLCQKILDRKSELLSFYVLRYKNKNLKANKFDFEQGGLQNARIELNNEGNVLLMGYYLEPKRFNPGVGVVLSEFDKESLAQSNVRFDLIKNEVMMNGLSERQQKRAQREIEAGRDLKLNREIIPLDFVRHDNGDISMIGEIQYLSYESSGVTQGGVLNRIIYNYEHIFVTRFAANGNILWSVKIPKMYRGGVDLIESFEVLVFGNDLHLIFNDNSDNFMPNPKKGTQYLSSRSRYNYMARYHIDKRGKIITNEIFDYSEEPYSRINVLSMFTDVAKTNSQELIFTTSGRMGYYYVLIGKNN